MFQQILELLFPSRCVLCRKVLTKDESDLCHSCRSDMPEIPTAKIKHSFLAGWTALWYYKDDVRRSLLRYKFHDARSYAPVFGRLLAMNVDKRWAGRFDILTWVPVSRRRRRRRGYDQVELLAEVVGAELQMPPARTLLKIRHNRPQSSINGRDQRRANVLGAYRAVDPAALAGKRILLLDDVITTGATASECARVLLTAGAKEIYFAAVATVDFDRNK